MLVQLMGGDIAVRSEPGKGSAFDVRLMLAAINQPRPAQTAPKRIVGYAGDRRMVMIVDDDEDQRDLVRGILEPIGFSVLTAANAGQCLAMAGDLRPDLFILDISMPGMNGWDLAHTLREGGQRGAILMLSANVGETQPASVENLAHDDVMVKPFAVQRLLDRIAGLLGLSWNEEMDAHANGAKPAPLSSPGREHIAELLRLGRIGYVRGIENKLDQLAANEKNHAFVAELRRHVRAFDFRRYTAALEEMGDG
jgi:CheY-like chemotaxis protein